ncbi:MAG: sodium:calcium antiporter [Gammaproteobacteria bacterium]|nr:sodium:calcium antiporter [Gammaproteobacteria bacterium]
MYDYLTLFAGIVCAGIGGELFVRGSVGLAHWVRVSPGIIGATVAAFATSSPELAVAISSAIAHKPQISMGDALGSNVVNVALILAIALLISGIQCPHSSIKRDFPMALFAPAITAALLIDGQLSRLDGFLLLCIFIVWLIATIIEARRQRSVTDKVLGEMKGWRSILLSIAGLILLISAGRLIVTGAVGIATAYGIKEFVIGATIVAVGTSVPELATAIISKLRGHDEVGLGTILGSNIFNGLFIISVAALIYPIAVDTRRVMATLLIGLVAVILTYPSRSGLVEPRRAAFLLALYAVYLVTILQR